jgi:hypothetical protein
VAPTTIPLSSGDKQVELISQRFERRLRAEYPLTELAQVPKRVRNDARMFWSERAWSEFAALPALSQILLKLVSGRAPFSEVASVSGILHDESLHTALSMRVAVTLGGYVPEVPEHLAMDPYALAAPNALALGAWLVAGGCIAETLSRALIHARLKHTRSPQLRAIISRTLRDENVHVAFAWAAAKRTVSQLTQGERRRLLQLAEPTVEATHRMQCTAGMQGAGLKAERRLRQRVADAGLGSCPPDEENFVVRSCIEKTIVPGLRRIGIAAAARERA